MGSDTVNDLRGTLLTSSYLFYSIKEGAFQQHIYGVTNVLWDGLVLCAVATELTA